MCDFSVLGFNYLDDKFVSSIEDDATIEKYYTKFVQCDDFSLNENVPELFYEFIYIYTEVPDFSSAQGLDFINKLLKKANNDKALVLLFVLMLNLFPSSTKLISLIKNVTIPQGMLIKYLKTELVKSSKLIDNYSRKASNFLIDSSKVKNYQLLHESSLGYSKLLTLVFEALQSPDALFMIDMVNSSILKLIGLYSLDPTRVLDALLDIFATNVLKNYRFCVQLLKRSLWWPDLSSKHPLRLIHKVLEGGSEIGSQLLIFKLLGFEAMKNNTPESLRCLIAILFKEGFISLLGWLDLIGPTDEEMSGLETAYKDHMLDKIFKASASALALAAPLITDDDESKEKPKARDKSVAIEDDPQVLQPLGKKNNNKYQLLRYFLLFGLYDQSVFMLRKYPVLAQIEDEIPSLIHRLVNAAIDKLYFQNYHPVLDSAVNDKLTAKAKSPFVKDNSLVEYEDYKCKEIEIFRLQHSNTDKNFHFFYYEWNEELPSVDSVEDLIELCNEILLFTGAKLSGCPELLIKLVRIAIKEVEKLNAKKQDKSLSIDDYGKSFDIWFLFFRKFIFPSISLLGSNSPLVEQVYELLQLFPIDKRFNLYGELEMKICKRNLDVNLEYDKATKSTKGGVKRLSKTNAHIIMRNLSKICISNPLPFFQVIATQVESYDNLIDLIVQSAKYYNDYAWDVLSYVLLTRLTSKRSIVQNDGLNDRLWLQNLSSFIGKLCLNFANRFNTSILSEFVIKRFYEYDSMTIILYKEILNNVSGIASISNLTAKQINSLNSGETCARLVYKVIHDNRTSKLNTRASIKYLNALSEDEEFPPPEGYASKLGELYILLANYYQQQTYLDRSADNHSKILSNRNDELNCLMHTYITMLNYFPASDDYLEKNLLPLEQLVEYGLEWAFELWRNELSRNITQEYKNRSSKLLTASKPWTKALAPIMKHMTQTNKLIDWKHLSSGLYATFWQLSLYDVNYNPATYDLKDKLTHSVKLYDNIVANKESTKRQIYDAKVERWEYKSMLSKIGVDDERHKEHSELVKQRVGLEKLLWFNLESDITAQAAQFLEYCLLPRIIHSSFDAIFCAEFLFLMLDNGLKDVVFEILDLIFQGNVIVETLSTSTPLESENLGLFFSLLFEYLDNLRDKREYLKLILGLELDEDEEMVDEGQEDQATNQSNEFRYKLFTWHEYLIADVIECLQNSDYLFRRNSITFLKNVLNVFPTLEDHGSQLLDELEDIFSTDEREDIRLASSALVGHLKARARKWARAYDFYEMPSEEKEKYIEEKQKYSNEEKQLQADIEAETKIQREEKQKLADGEAEEAAKEEEQRRLQKEAEKRAEELKEKEKRDAEEAEAAALKPDKIEVDEVEQEKAEAEEKLEAEEPKKDIESSTASSRLSGLPSGPKSRGEVSSPGVKRSRAASNGREEPEVKKRKLEGDFTKIRKSIDTKDFKSVLAAIPNKYLEKLKEFEKLSNNDSNKSKMIKIFNGMVEDIGKDEKPNTLSETKAQFSSYVNKHFKQESDIKLKLAKEKELNKKRSQGSSDHLDRRKPDVYRGGYGNSSGTFNSNYYKEGYNSNYDKKYNSTPSASSLNTGLKKSSAEDNGSRKSFNSYNDRSNDRSQPLSRRGDYYYRNNNRR